MPATRPIQELPDAPRGLLGEEADELLARRAIRASRPGVNRERSNGNSSVGGQAVAGATRVRGGSV